MKELWKKIFVGTLLTTAVAGFSGCNCTGNKDNNVSIDLDGDGVVSEWETVFGTMSKSDRTVKKVTVVNVASLEELKAIDGKAKDTAYVLTKNIDCNGETLAINIGASNYLYGNNRIIRNFKLGEAKIDSSTETIDNGLKEYLNSSSQVSVNCFLYNAGAIYDLRLFMGNQVFNPQNDCTNFDASAINSCQFVDNVTIKGAIKVKPNVDDGVKKFNLALGIVDHSGENIEISNIETQGIVSYEDGAPGRLNSDGVKISAIIPELSAGSTIYNANAKTNLYANTNAKVSAGLITAVNNGFVTTTTGNGDINMVYTDSSSLACGGIVGTNEQLGEIRNSTMNGKIDFTSNIDFAITNTLKTQARVGGIVGKNTAGVIDYCTSDAIITGNNLTTLYIGGLCGESDRGIFNNVISRGSITLKDIDGVTMANLVGKSAYGVIEKAIVLTNISLDNSSNSFSKVKLGMVTVFEEGNKSSFQTVTEDGEEPMTKYYYDMVSSQQKTPEFAYILVGGTNEVYLKSEASGKNEFEYNLGLRNTYEYKTQSDIGSDKLDSYVGQMQMFHSLYYLTNYTVNKYEPIDGVKTKMILNLTYSERVTSASDSMVYSPKWFSSWLYLNYGANQGEVDLSGVNSQDKEASLKTIKYVLSDSMAKSRYFLTESYNGGLARFDKKFDSISENTDGNYDPNDELFSYLNYLINCSLNNDEIKWSKFTTLLFNKEFFVGKTLSENENGESVLVDTYSVPLFVDRVSKALSQMGCTVDIKYYALGGIECDVNNDDLSRVRLSASSTDGSNINSYVFTFDVKDFVMKKPVTDESGLNYYLIGLKYNKSNVAKSA